MTFDVIVVGGSYAGLAAALQVARTRRKVLVIDEGRRRNRSAHASYGFLTQDGRPPDKIAEEGRAQLMAYPTVQWLEGRAQRASAAGDGFSVTMADGGSFEARRLVLATGVVDELPDVPGLSERWGEGVYHCPYCHGYELANGRIGVLATSPDSMHHALLLPDWGPTTFFLNGVFIPDAEEMAKLERRGVAIESTPIREIAGDPLDVVLADERVISLVGLFTATDTHMASPLAEQLGCAFEEGSVGPFIETDSFKETSVPGVFACGDAGRPAGAVALAVGDGTLAGIGAHQSLIFRDG